MKFILSQTKKTLNLSHDFKVQMLWIILALAIISGICGVTRASEVNDLSDINSIHEDINYNHIDIVTDPEAELELTKIIKNLRFINAEFSQTVSNSSGMILQEQRGIIKLKKPNLLNWEVTIPERLIIIIDGEKVWHYDADLEQIVVKKISKQIHTNPISKLLLSDLNDNLTEFKINYWTDHSKCNLGFRLLPKDPEQSMGFVECYLGFNRNHQLIFIKMIDQLNQEITFNFLKFKSKIDNASFRFKVPPGVDIIEEE